MTSAMIEAVQAMYGKLGTHNSPGMASPPVTGLSSLNSTKAMDHDQLYEAALDAVSALHGDTSVDRRTTRNDLRALREEIDVFIDALDHDEHRDHDEAG